MAPEKEQLAENKWGSFVSAPSQGPMLVIETCRRFIYWKGLELIGLVSKYPYPEREREGESGAQRDL